ncbi:hypothetical protein ACQPU1_01435 [Clostridium paraputrificum]|uniref:hypothetical protein n=1 Tax=Clostridium paraputrificum TaxID=29363 RepID=UPI003D349558
MSKVYIEYTESADHGSKQVSNGVEIQLDDNHMRTELVLEDNLVSNVADSILHSLEEFISEELNDKILSLESRIEELEETMEVKDQYIDYLKRFTPS